MASYGYDDAFELSAMAATPRLDQAELERHLESELARVGPRYTDPLAHARAAATMPRPQLPTGADMPPAGTPLPLGPPNPTNPTVFFDVSIGGKPAGRLVFELRADKLPDTSRNFMLLASESMGFGYAATKMHRIIPGLFCQGGDVLFGSATDGSGGLSAIGKASEPFADECFDYKHVGRGVLAMGNAGEAHGNRSQHYITFGATPWLDGNAVVFGQLLKGWSVLAAIEAVGTAPSGMPKRTVLVSEAGILTEGKHSLGAANLQLYRLLGGMDNGGGGGGAENDSTMPSLRALTIERVGEIESAKKDAELEELLFARHLKFQQQKQDELDVANGKSWAASAIEMMVRLGRDDPGYDPTLALVVSEQVERTTDRAVHSDALRRWPMLRQHTATMANVRAACKAVSKPASIARTRAAALEQVGPLCVEEWQWRGHPASSGKKVPNPEVSAVQERSAEQKYRSTLPLLERLSAAKQALRLDIGTVQWAESRNLVKGPGSVDELIGPSDQFVSAAFGGDASDTVRIKEMQQEVWDAEAALEPAKDALQALTELRVRQEVQRSFNSTSPTLDSAEAKRLQMQIEALELQGLSSAGGFAEAMGAVTAEVMATCEVANPWNVDAPLEGEEGERYAAIHADVLTRHTPPYIVKAEAAFHHALAEVGPCYAVQALHKIAKRQKMAGAAALKLLDMMQRVTPNSITSVLSEVYAAADAEAEAARAELRVAHGPRSRWKKAQLKLLVAKVMQDFANEERDKHNETGTLHTSREGKWVKDMMRHANVETQVHEGNIEESIERKLSWGRAKHRLYRACGEKSLLNDLESAVMLRSQEEHEAPSRLSWMATCDRERLIVAMQIADAQTQLDGIMTLQNSFAVAKERVVQAEGYLRSRLHAAKGRAVVRHSVRVAKAKVLSRPSQKFSLDNSAAIVQSSKAAINLKKAHDQEEETLFIMTEERVLWAHTLFTCMSKLSCNRTRIKADKLLRQRVESHRAAVASSYVGIICDIQPEWGYNGDQLPWGGNKDGSSVVIPAEKKVVAAVKEVVASEAALLDRMGASALFRKHKGALSWMSRFEHILGKDMKAARQKLYDQAEMAKDEAAYDLIELPLTWNTFADQRGALQAIRLSELAYYRMSSFDEVNRADLLLRHPVGELLAQMSMQRLRSMQLGSSMPTDIQTEYKATRLQFAMAASVVEITWEYAATRAQQTTFESEEARVARKLVADTAAEVQRKVWEATAGAGIMVSHEMARRRLLLLTAAAQGAEEAAPLAITGIRNRNIAIDVIARSQALTARTREVLAMDEGKEKMDAVEALNEEAQEVAHIMNSLQKPSTAGHIVEALDEKHQDIKSRRTRSVSEIDSLERETATVRVQLQLLKSERRRCSVAAEAFPGMVKDLLSELGDNKLGDPDEVQARRLSPIVVQAVTDGFLESTAVLETAVQKAEKNFRGLQDNLDAVLHLGAYRREVESLHARTAYFVECSRRQEDGGDGATSGLTENMREQTMIAVVNGLGLHVPRGSRLRPYHEWP